jgi:hypothetical protein
MNIALCNGFSTNAVSPSFLEQVLWVAVSGLNPYWRREKRRDSAQWASRETPASSGQYAHSSSSFVALLPGLPLIGCMWSCIALVAVAALIKCHVGLLFTGMRAVLLPLLLVVGQLHEVKFWASGQTCRHRE